MLKVIGEIHEGHQAIVVDQEMSRMWACMDGCSNMEDLINGKPNYSNSAAYDAAHLRHQICAGVCCKQYMAKLGCA